MAPRQPWETSELALTPCMAIMALHLGAPKELPGSHLSTETIFLTQLRLELVDFVTQNSYMNHKDRARSFEK